MYYPSAKFGDHHIDKHSGRESQLLTAVDRVQLYHVAMYEACMVITSNKQITIITWFLS